MYYVSGLITMIQIRIVPEAKLVKLNFLCGNQDI